jgi:hypothetical protein
LPLMIKKNKDSFADEVDWFVGLSPDIIPIAEEFVSLTFTSCN